MNAPEPPPEPLAPPSGSPVAERLAAEWRDAPLKARTLLVVYLAIGAWGGLSSGIVLSREFPNVWVIAGSLFILEPIGLACLLALVAIIAPHSALTELLTGALKRARLALCLILLCVAGLILFMFGFVAREWHSLQR